MSYLLAINCGSSSIKGKLYHLPPSTNDPLNLAASLSVSNISSKGEKIKIKISWDEEEGRDVDEQGEDGGDVEYKSLVPLLLEKLTKAGKVDKSQIKYVTHRVVHGGEHKEGIIITKGHTEGLEEMDKLSDFAPLHNHHAVLAVRSCLDALPDHTSLLLFDTLFHQTIPAAARTYALPPSELDNPMPLQKYGFHGLSYASIVASLSKHLKKPAEEINIVVAHLGSGASAACIQGGKSIDTSMGLTPLEGLIGGTRCGTIDPTAVFHLLRDPGADGGADGMKVSKAELTLNKCVLRFGSGRQSGALAGTTNFGLITTRINDPSSCSADEHKASKLAYDVYLDRLMSYISQYIFKLYSTSPSSEGIDGLVFSGGIGEKSADLRKDVIQKLGWLGAKIDDQANGHSEGLVREITAKGSRFRGYVVETDEEGWCARMAREQLGF